MEGKEEKTLWQKLWPWLLGFAIAGLAAIILLNVSKTGQNGQSLTKKPVETKRKQIRDIIEKVFGKTRYEKMMPLFYVQAFHETGDFTSNAFVEKNNAVGMKEALFRKTTDTDNPEEGGDETGYSEYKNVKESFDDLLYWLEDVDFPVIDMSGKRSIRELCEEYAGLLKSKGYFEDSIENYSKGMINAKL